MTTTEQKGVDCPNCYLAPEQVAPGEHYPLDYGPGLVLCPKCGLVRHSGKSIAEIRSDREGRMARGLFYAETRKGLRRGSSDPVGEAKPKVYLPGQLRAEQGLPGFAEPDRASRPTSIAALGKHVNPWITKELDDWLIETAVRLECKPSDTVRACLSWAFQFAPSIEDRVLTDGSKARWKRMSVRLKEADMAMLSQIAEGQGLSGQRYVVCLMDQLRRRSSWSKHLQPPER